MKIGDPLPEFVLDSLAHNTNIPTLFHFWSISCPACKANMPHLQEIRDEYGRLGMKAVAIHMPRGDSELEEAKVRNVAAEIGITEILILDNDHKFVDAFGVSAVPAYYLFDADGKLRRHALGNFGIRMVGQTVRRLFGEKE